MIGALLVLLDQLVGPCVPRLLCPLYDATLGAAAHAEQERWRELAWPEVEVVDEIEWPTMPRDPGATVIPLRSPE